MSLFNKIELNIDYLLSSNLFNGLSAFEIETFLNEANFDILEFECDEKVPIDVEKSIFILSGSLGTYNNRPDGTSGFINKFEPEGNNLIAVSMLRPYPFEDLSIIARKKSVVLMLETKSFTEIKPHMLPIQNVIQSNIIKIFYYMTGDVAERTYINTETYASARLRKYLSILAKKQNSYDIKIPLIRSELADYLNINLSTLNKELNKFSQRGYISVKGRNIEILDKSFID